MSKEELEEYILNLDDAFTINELLGQLNPLDIDTRKLIHVALYDLIANDKLYYIDINNKRMYYKKGRMLSLIIKFTD